MTVKKVSKKSAPKRRTAKASTAKAAKVKNVDELEKAPRRKKKAAEKDPIHDAHEGTKKREGMVKLLEWLPSDDVVLADNVDRVTPQWILDNCAKGVVKHYLEALKVAAKENTNETIRIDPGTPEGCRVMVAGVRSNDVNRSPVASHVSAIGADIESDYCPALSRHAYSFDGKQIDGGHSGRGKIAGWLPPRLQVRLDLFRVVAEVERDGKKVKEWVPAPLPVSYVGIDEIGLHEPELPPHLEVEDKNGVPLVDRLTFEEAVIESAKIIAAKYPNPRDREFQVVLNCHLRLLKKCDDLMRKRLGAEQLELDPAIRAWCENSPAFKGNFKLLEQVLKALYLRAKASWDEEGYPTYGDPDGGGNTSKQKFPVFCYAWADGLLYLDDVVKSAGGGEWIDAKYRAGTKDIRKTRAAIPRKDIMVVLAACDTEQRNHLLSILQGERASKALDDLCVSLRKPDGLKASLTWSRPGAVSIQAILFAAANGGRPSEAADAPAISQQEGCRGPGWDIGEEWEGMFAHVSYHENPSKHVSGLMLAASFAEISGGDDTLGRLFAPKRSYANRKKAKLS